MKTCYVCGRHSVIQEFVWTGNQCTLKEVCVNPRCKIYNPYVLYRWRSNRNG